MRGSRFDYTPARARLVRLRWWQFKRDLLDTLPGRELHAFARATVDALARVLP